MFVKRRPSREYFAFLFLLSISTMFVLNSFPFMFPGYDMWWHMGSIEAARWGPSGPSGRGVWHSLWGSVFNWLPDFTIFERALIVHRFQFLLSGFLVGLSGYWLLRTIFHRTTVRRSELFILAWVGTVTWFLMLGTWSNATGGGADSFAKMSWISWYSLNYQISLPFSLLASAALIFSMSMPLRPVQRILMLLTCAGSLLITAALHAAEASYFVVSAIIVGGLYLRGRKGLLMSACFILLAVAFVYFALQFSDRTPEFLQLAIQGNWAKLAASVAQYGHLLVDLGRNRSVTGWNTLTTMSVLLLIPCLFISWKLRSSIEWKPVAYVLLTGFMPLALLYKWSAGLLATITYLDIAWRFAFSSFLFLGLPIFLALFGLILKERGKLIAQITAALLIGVSVFFHSQWLDPVHTVISFARSIVHSFDREKMYFDLSTEEHVALEKMHQLLLKADPEKPVCVDVFSAHYLFFLKGFRNLYLPGNLDQLPTVVYQNIDCNFPRDGGDLIPLGILIPPWRFDLLAVTAN